VKANGSGTAYCKPKKNTIFVNAVIGGEFQLYKVKVLSACGIQNIGHHHHHHHIRLLEVVKRNRQHTVQKIDVGIYMDIHTIHAYASLIIRMVLFHFSLKRRVISTPVCCVLSIH